MKRSDLLKASSPKAIARYVARNAPKKRRAGHMGRHAMESVREATYNGHHIVIHTSYRIEVDGKALEGHVAVNNAGQVHYHAIPNAAFGSAVDMVKSLIDVYPDDFPTPGRARRKEG